jgi:glucose-1-phosphate cytidylyltransferase
LTEARPPVAILCGGRGTRLREKTAEIPKALVEIGGLPILWHVIRIYAAQGFDRFLLLTGHKGEMISSWAAGQDWGTDVSVEPLPTGEETPTGGRVKRAAEHLAAGTFCVTYADGVADIDLGAELDFHRDHGAEGTVAVVRPRLQFGVARLGADGRVEGFEEKPMLDMWINGGFFCFEPAFLERLSDGHVLEREPLAGLAAEGGLRGYRHDGFWDCMDTYKDAVELDDLWAKGEAPWRA